MSYLNHEYEVSKNQESKSKYKTIKEHVDRIL